MAYISEKAEQPMLKLVCRSGMAWITRANDLHDYVLEEGKELSIQNTSDKILVESLSENLEIDVVLLCA